MGVLLFVAGSALVSSLTDIGLDTIAEALSEASLALVVLAFLVSMSARFANAVALSGLTPTRVPLSRLTMLQLAMSFVNLAMPATAGRVAVNIRFFQRSGVEPTTAVAIGALDGFTGFLSQMILMGTVLLFGLGTLELHIDETFSLDNVGALLLALAIVLAVAVAVVALVPALRRRVVGAVTKLREFLGPLLRSPRRLVTALSANLVAELIYALTQYIVLAAFDQSVPFADVVLVNIVGVPLCRPDAGSRWHRRDGGGVDGGIHRHGSARGDGLRGGPDEPRGHLLHAARVRLLRLPLAAAAALPLSRRLENSRLQLLDVPVRRHRDGPAIAGRLIVEQTVIGPPSTFVEPPSPRVSGDDGEPRAGVTSLADLAFGLGHEYVSHAGAAVWPGDVDLLDLGVDNHHESGDLAFDHGDRRVGEARWNSRPERVLVACREQLAGHMAEVSVAPAEMPDLGDRRRIAPLCRTKLDVVSVHGFILEAASRTLPYEYVEQATDGSELETGSRLALA